MELVLKTLSFVLLGIGAFLVYGAKFVAAKLEHGRDDEVQTGNSAQEKDVNELYSAGTDEENQDADDGVNHQVNRKVLNIKLAGMFFVMAGGILALVVFRQ